jgi:hypothetical protein
MRNLMFSEGLVAFKAEHLLRIAIDENNSDYREMVDSGVAKRLEGEQSVSFMRNGYPVGCGGICEIWNGRGHSWSVFSKRSLHCQTGLIRAMNRWIAWQLKNHWRRIEASVDIDFPKGKKRLELLGFRLETALAKKYLPDGKDCSIYSLVRGDE